MRNKLNYPGLMPRMENSNKLNLSLFSLLIC